MTGEQYRALVAAHTATRKAYLLLYEEPKAPLLVRLAVGRAESILMRYVVRYAALAEPWPGTRE